MSKRPEGGRIPAMLKYALLVAACLVLSACEKNIHEARANVSQPLAMTR